MASLFAGALLAACASQGPPLESADAADSLLAAFIAIGPGGMAVARVITGSVTCPDIEADGTRIVMTVRAAPATIAQRPTASAPNDSKPSAFPVTTCDALLPVGVRRASAGGHALAVPKLRPQRIVVIGDSGCRLKVFDGGFQACNDPAAWPFAQVVAAAAAAHPDLVIHVGDYHYRENACPAWNSGCAGSPWGYGWDAWDADFFAPAKVLLAAAPWIFVRGNHESCNRAGQGWWRFLDPRPMAPGRDCNDPANDSAGDYSEPYAVGIADDTQAIVFDSSNVVIPALVPSDPMYRIYNSQMGAAFALVGDASRNIFIEHHPVLGFAPNPSEQPTGLYPGNLALQSVLRPTYGERYFPANVQALLAGHYHLFEMVSFATSQPAQLISGNAGAYADAPLPVARARTAQPAPGARIENILSTSEHGFMIMERGSDGTWRIEAHDRRGQTLTTCTLRSGDARCEPETLP